jgi:gamma-glutamyl phosphate reductase
VSATASFRSPHAAVTATSSDVLGIDSSSLGFNAQGVFSAGKNVGTGLQVAVSGTFLTSPKRICCE